MLRIAVATLLLQTAPVAAQDWAPRGDDVLFDRATLDDRLRGTTITFFYNGQSRFFEDGRYTYTYANDGGTGYGYFEVTDESTVCIDFVTGFARCDLYVLDAAQRLVVITEAGDRFPTRPRQ